MAFSIYLPYRFSALLSGDRLTGVRLRDTVTGEESVVDCDGVFVSDS